MFVVLLVVGTCVLAIKMGFSAFETIHNSHSRAYCHDLSDTKRKIPHFNAFAAELRLHITQRGCLVHITAFPVGNQLLC